MKLTLRVTVLLVAMIGFTACSTSQIETQDPISLNLEGVPGHKDLYSIHSQTLVENVSPDKLLRQKIETVEFDVATQIEKVDKKNSTIEMETTTTKKDGSLSLNDMAYPELDETIDFVFDKRGRVLHAGRYSPDTIFFVSPLPLPDRPVKVGDTWTYETEWVTQDSRLPMKIQLVMVLKKALKCYDKEYCAEVEWSGRVFSDELKMPIVSHINGYTLYRPKTGSQIWTWSRNEEQMEMQGVKMRVSTCIQSILKSEKSKINPYANKEPTCDPSLSLPM
jgi:hypothetical protein